jgi:hypothetical protein
MTPSQPIRAIRARHAIACLAALALSLAACSNANPPASPSSSAASGTEAAPTATPAPTPTPVPTATPAPTITPTLRVAAAPSPGPIGTLPPPANRPQTIHLILHPYGDEEISVDRAVTGCRTEYCQGDYRLGVDPLFGAATGKQVGTLAYMEFVVTTDDPLWLSPANTITLEGRGQIVFSELLHDDGSGRPATGAILGGTGEFTGATGYVTSRSLGGHGDFVITITK